MSFFYKNKRFENNESNNSIDMRPGPSTYYVIQNSKSNQINQKNTDPYFPLNKTSNRFKKKCLDNLVIKRADERMNKMNESTIWLEERLIEEIFYKFRNKMDIQIQQIHKSKNKWDNKEKRIKHDLGPEENLKSIGFDDKALFNETSSLK